MASQHARRERYRPERFHRAGSAILLALLLATPAAAQYVATPLAGVPYPALTSSTVITLTVDGGIPNPDRGRATVPLGFTFPFYDRTYTQLTVTANGLAFFEPDPDTNANYILNFAIPNTTQPNGLLAPFWDDLSTNAGSTVRSQALTGSNGAGLAIEWRDFNRAFGAYSLTFQLRVWENGLIEFLYGTMEGNGATISATIGIESPSGGSGTAPYPCGGICDLTTLAPPSTDGGAAPPPVTYMKFGPPPGIDLQALALRATSITQNAGVLSVSTELQLRNFGTVPSGPFSYRLYLSQDTIVDSADVELTPTPVSVNSLAANETRSVTSTGQVPKPDAGSWYVLAFADLENVVSEPPERRANNTAATSVPYSAGVDLVAEKITAPLSTGPGDLLSVPIAFTNQGFDLANAPVPIRIWASTDSKLDGTDRLLFSTTRTVVGGEAVRDTLSFAMPSNITADTYALILQLDDTPGVILEASKTNNVVVSATKMIVRQPDLVMDVVTVRRAAAPFEQTATAFFGEPIRIDAQLRNQGGSPAANVSVQLYLSDNETLNGLSDATIGAVTGLTLAAGETQVITLTTNVPTRSPSNAVLQTQPYFFFAAAIAPGLGETNSANNAISSAATLVRGPAPNVLPLSVQGPARVGAGETTPVARTLANFGNRPAMNVKYRYYLSANTQITTEDVLLQIRLPDGSLVNERSVDLAVNAQDSANELVVIPSALATSTLYLGVLMDPDGVIDDSERDDNGLAGQQVQVIGRALSVATQTVPDAVVGQPYSVHLSAQSGEAYTWSASNVPAGLSVSAEGEVSGVPTAAGVFGFTVTVASNGRTAQALLTIRVVAPTVSLAISTQSLPSPVRSLPYTGQFGAVGGKAPYRWSILSGELPTGVTLDSSGALSGAPSDAVGTVESFVVGVRDAVGNGDSRSFSVRVVDPAPLQIVSPALPDGVVGNEYLALLALKNASGAVVATPVSWRVVSGALPDGLQFEDSTADTEALSGTPQKTGLFTFRVEAVDALGRVAGLNAVVLVYGAAVKISGVVPDTVVVSDTVSVQLVATPAQPGSAWVIRDGRLPPGLSLSSDGLLSGTVKQAGSYTFTVGVGATRADLRGLATYRIDASEPVAKKTTGCASTTGVNVLLGVLLLLTRSRRRG